MGLIVRYSPRERLLRSVGDAPNGIIGIAWGKGGARWVCDSKWTKRPGQKGTEVETLHPADQEEALETIVDLELADIVAGAENRDCLLEIANAAIDVLEKAVRPAFVHGDPDALRVLLELVVDTCSRINEALA